MLWYKVNHFFCSQKLFLLLLKFLIYVRYGDDQKLDQAGQDMMSLKWHWFSFCV